MSFKLPNKKVNIKFIPRASSLATSNNKDHVISGGLLSSAIIKYGLPLQRNGTVKNILTNEEKEYLEELLGVKLSVYGDYWTDFTVQLRKTNDGNILDLNNPIDYIKYKILLTYNRTEIAPSWAEKDDLLSYRFAITEEGEVFKETLNRFEIKQKAFAAFAKIESNAEQLLSVLKLLTSRPISPNTSLDSLREKVSQYVDSEPVKFLNVVDDSNFEIKAIINTAVEKGIVTKSGNKYVTSEGLELCEPGEIASFVNAVRYLNNPAHQDVLLLIESKIEKLNKKK